jgi:hypothetical protein
LKTLDGKRGGRRALHSIVTSDFFSGCPIQEIGQTFLFKGHKVGTCSYFGADSATKKSLVTTVEVCGPSVGRGNSMS